MFLLHLFDAAFSTKGNYLNDETAELVSNWILFNSNPAWVELLLIERKPKITFGGLI